MLALSRRKYEPGRDIMTVYASRHARCASTDSEGTRLSASSIQFTLSKKRCCGGRPQRRRFVCLCCAAPIRFFREIEGQECCSTCFQYSKFVSRDLKLTSGRQMGDCKRRSSSEMVIISSSQCRISENRDL